VGRVEEFVGRKLIMEILTRKVCHYLEVKVRTTEAEINLGLLDKEEAAKISAEFLAASIELQEFSES
jgi:hypothetical protein